MHRMSLEMERPHQVAGRQQRRQQALRAYLKGKTTSKVFFEK